jgi:GT2 family glycosyltransferase
VTYNSAEALPGLLDSLSAGLAGINEFEVIIADNDSRDQSVALASSHPIKPKIIRMGRNAGYAAGINAACRALRLNADVLILNPDTRLMPGTARILLDRLRSPEVGIAVPKILHENGTIAWSLRREPSLVTAWSDAVLGGRLAAHLRIGEAICDSLAYETGGNVEWATGAVLAVATRARHLVAEWDESFFLYSEEVDYLRKVREQRLAVAYVPQAQVVHIGGEYRDNPRLSALMAANQIRYYRRHHGALATVAFRLALVVGSTLRFALGPGHRAALWAALTHWKPPPETPAPVASNGQQ